MQRPFLHLIRGWRGLAASPRPRSRQREREGIVYRPVYTLEVTISRETTQPLLAQGRFPGLLLDPFGTVGEELRVARSLGWEHVRWLREQGVNRSIGFHMQELTVPREIALGKEGRTGAGMLMGGADSREPVTCIFEPFERGQPVRVYRGQCDATAQALVDHLLGSGGAIACQLLFSGGRRTRQYLPSYCRGCWPDCLDCRCALQAGGAQEREALP
jgi:hypothetical protein